MYAPGKILRAGGGDPAIARTQVIDMTAATPRWEETGPMAFPRRRMNTPILLDGSVMAVGGTRRSDDKTQAVLQGEIWNPATKTWSEVSVDGRTPRMYHSTALTLPDGRVVTAGGEADGMAAGADLLAATYRSRARGPAITSSPPARPTARASRVGTDSADIAKVALLEALGRDARDRHEPALRAAELHEVGHVAERHGAGQRAPRHRATTCSWSRTPTACPRSPGLRVGGGTTPPASRSAPTAAFSATPPTGTAPPTVSFSDASTGSPTAWQWDFQNDGTVDSTAREPVVHLHDARAPTRSSCAPRTPPAATTRSRPRTSRSTSRAARRRPQGRSTPWPTRT